MTRSTILLLLVAALTLPAADEPFAAAWTTIDGTSLTLAPAQDQRPLLIVFWASWCVSCNREVGLVKALHERNAQGGLRIVSVSVDKDVDAAHGFVQRHTVPYPVVHDPGLVIADGLEAEGTPFFVLIDADGHIHTRSKRFDKDFAQHLQAVGATL